MRTLLLMLFAGMLLSLPAHAVEQAAPAKAKKCLFPKSRKVAPAWVCDSSKEGLALSAVGYSPKSRAGLEFMKDMATADARSKLANKAQAQVRQKIAEQDPAAGSAPNKAKIEKITQTTLEGTKILKSAHTPKGSLYVLIGMDEENAQQLYESVASQYLQK